MVMMKKPIILVTCIVLFFSLGVLASPNSSSPSECCFQFHATRLPKDKVVNYRFTDARCAITAVLITMKKGGMICVDPTVPWVKRIIEDKEWIHRKQ